METTFIENPQETGEVELVLGQRQVAGVLFVAIVVIALFSTVAFVAGRGVGSIRAASRPMDVTPAAPIRQPARAAETSVALVPVVKPSASAAPALSVPAPVAPATGKASAFPEKAPLRSSLGPDEPAPKPGEVYLQIGAVERGFAEIVVTGLRARGYTSVFAPSSSDKIYRVLIGPLQDAEAFSKTRAEVEAAGLNFFARRYVVEAAPPVSSSTSAAVQTTSQQR